MKKPPAKQIGPHAHISIYIITSLSYMKIAEMSTVGSPSLKNTSRNSGRKKSRRIRHLLRMVLKWKTDQSFFFAAVVFFAAVDFFAAVVFFAVDFAVVFFAPVFLEAVVFFGVSG